MNLSLHVAVKLRDAAPAAGTLTLSTSVPLFFATTAPLMILVSTGAASTLVSVASVVKSFVIVQVTVAVAPSAEQTTWWVSFAVCALAGEANSATAARPTRPAPASVINCRVDSVKRRKWYPQKNSGPGGKFGCRRKSG
ncbi:MAG: hypothetical protein QOI74_2096 [Micromonosporaceae bacterium]|nr:hypothetical protein [Micromonosporaceae bacterium]